MQCAYDMAYKTTSVVAEANTIEHDLYKAAIHGTRCVAGWRRVGWHVDDDDTLGQQAVHDAVQNELRRRGFVIEQRMPPIWNVCWRGEFAWIANLK